MTFKTRRILMTSSAVVVGLALVIGILIFSMPARADNLIFNSDFESGVSWPWTTSQTWPGTVNGIVEDRNSDGNKEFCVTVENIGNAGYDVQMRQRRLHIQEGHQYTASFTAVAYHSQNVTITTKVTQGHFPYKDHGSKANIVLVPGESQPVSFEFTGKLMPDSGRTEQSMEDTAAEFTFLLGASGNQGATICFDDIRLEDPEYVPPPITPPSTPKVRVNQTGYLATGAKKASVISASTDTLTWQLVDSNGTVVDTNSTIPFGIDASSGDSLHIIDFSSYTGEGAGYMLVVDGEASHPFDISNSLYRQMKTDAMAYFYHNRSGTAIEEQYVGAAYARGAGHAEQAGEGLSRDGAVPCFTGTALDNSTWADCVMTVGKDGVQTNNPPMFTSDYRVNGLLGWYDAGDHGKYVVNGGISVWTLLNLYEQNPFAFPDQSMSIPYAGNGVPDILDEARWELEFMLNMQVPPEGSGYTVPVGGVSASGLVHHMLHDIAWTDLPNRADEVFGTVNPTPSRAVYPPSTAATLNLAAVGAQCARIWENIDPEFSKRCSDAAQRAWDAAVVHPNIYAVEKGFNGGGPYPDYNVQDECYWAAAELFITTGNSDYAACLNDPSNASYYLSVPTTLGDEGSGPMTWGDTAALGTISLATVPNVLATDDVNTARANIIAAADAFIANEASEGYGTPYKSGTQTDFNCDDDPEDPDDCLIPIPMYAWGSNSFVLNEMIIMGLAHDLTGEAKYFNGLLGGLDYLLGRNAMDKSYVSGYGENPLQNPHHRHWAYQAWPRDDMRYPPPPAGAISGGPNSQLIALADNKATNAMGLFDRCWGTPQKCYVDDVDAFAVNEITINWNAPFVWALAYIDSVMTNNGTDGAVYVTARSLVDGKVIIGGDFTTIDGQPRQNIARRNADGTLDETFNPGADGPVRALEVDQYGRILVGGEFTVLAGQPRNRIGRLDPTGASDPNFDPGPGADGPIYALDVNGVGTIFVGGDFDNLRGEGRSNYGRLNDNGTLDACNPGVNGPVNAIDFLTGDSKTVIAGDFTEVAGVQALGSARLNPDCTVDCVVTIEPGECPETCAGVCYTIIQSRDWSQWIQDATLINSNETTCFYRGTQCVNNNVEQLCPWPLDPVAEYSDPRPEGTPITTCFDAQANGACLAARSLPGNRLLLGGSFTQLAGQPVSGIGVLSENGSLDGSFSSAGVNGTVNAVAIQPDGKIVIGGEFTEVGGQGRQNIARLNADGSLDDSFNPGVNGPVYTLLILDDGVILVGGDFSLLDGEPYQNIGPINTTPGPGDDLTVEVILRGKPEERVYNYCADVYVTNNSSKPVDWTANFEVAVGDILNQFWNAIWSQNGTQVAVEGCTGQNNAGCDSDWNNILQPGETTHDIGFCADIKGAPAKPGDAEVAVTVNNDWGSGYCAKIVVTNKTNQALDWIGTFDLASVGGGIINNMWGASYTLNGSQVTIQGVESTNALPAGLSSNAPSLNWDIGFCTMR
ncbi:MAG: glycoside hydrolase family 9 protein [Anaerolineae bacterium]|nr:glycoside hydrolase family 9 protein [Anaerolineae bacterium]